MGCVWGCQGSWWMSLWDCSLSSLKGGDDCGRSPMGGKRLILDSSSKRVRRSQENCKLVSFTSVSRKVTEQIFPGAISRHMRRRTHRWMRGPDLRWLSWEFDSWTCLSEAWADVHHTSEKLGVFFHDSGQSESLWQEKSQTLSSWE